MQVGGFRHKTVSQHQFSAVPMAHVPRSQFMMTQRMKTTFDASYLVPMYCEEMLPGDRFNMNATFFCRLSTPTTPFMDMMTFETFYFFCPLRLVWTNFPKFMGEQENPGDSISYLIPTLTVLPAVGSIHDYFGLPTAGQVTGNLIVSCLPFRAYNLIWNQWFRDQNMQASVTVDKSDGPDVTSYALLKSGKRHDMFTSALPFLQKGTAVPLLSAGQATVKTNASALFTGAQQAMQLLNVSGAALGNVLLTADSGKAGITATAGAATAYVYPSNLYADLSTATQMNINLFRQAIMVQMFLETNARGGTRYVEICWNHFGVQPQDFRLQRPEYIGGGSSPVTVAPIATTADSASHPVGQLGAFGTLLGHNHGFSYSAMEHGYVIGLMRVRAEVTYQQGVRKHWKRSTLYDFYDPAFAHLGEQAVLNQEIYATGAGGGSVDTDIFGYQERWAEYRYTPSYITAKFRSTAAGTLDYWHLAQKFTAVPVLNNTFINDATNSVLQRVLAAGAAADGAQFLCDAVFENRAARPMPMYSVPGLGSRF